MYQLALVMKGMSGEGRHNEYTEFQYVNAYDTAEKIMLYLSQRCSVIGISATATIPIVVGNYDTG